jgi:hypothetical protein
MKGKVHPSVATTKAKNSLPVGSEEWEDDHHSVETNKVLPEPLPSVTMKVLIFSSLPQSSFSHGLCKCNL